MGRLVAEGRIVVLTIKAGVRIKGLHSAMVRALPIVEDVYGTVECVITSGADGKHMFGSLHPRGKALDFRTRNLPSGALGGVIDAIRQRLGPDYDVIKEKDHLHVEYDPK